MAKHTKDTIKALLVNDKAVLRGLLVIDALQTETEREIGDSVVLNGVGWSGTDAEFMSSLAKQYRQRGTLSEKQMVWARKKIQKYAGQLAKVANGEIENPMTTEAVPTPAPKPEPENGDGVIARLRAESEAEEAEGEEETDNRITVDSGLLAQLEASLKN